MTDVQKGDLVYCRDHPGTLFYVSGRVENKLHDVYLHVVTTRPHKRLTIDLPPWVPIFLDHVNISFLPSHGLFTKQQLAMCEPAMNEARRLGLRIEKLV